MNYKFEEKNTESQPSVSDPNQGFELSPRQAEIYRNLEAIGPEIAAFYLNGVKTLQDKDNEIASYQLAHIAREIDGGLRDVLTNVQDKKKIQKRLAKEDIGDLKDRIGHIASILSALGIDDLYTPLAKRWINVATKFHQYAHRHGSWKTPRSKDEFIPLWYEFEDVLVELVGNYFNLLNMLDRILEHEEPTDEIIKTLPKLLASESRRAYFFENLDFSGWLKPLRDAGWFDPKQYLSFKEVPNQQDVHIVSPWYALEYVENIASQVKNHTCEETVEILSGIINDIVDYANHTLEGMESDRTNCRIIEIMCTLPINKIKKTHINFIGIALKSRMEITLVNSTIGETVLPKLLNGGSKELTLVLLEDMLDAKVINAGIKPVMQEYWLGDALHKHGQAIAEVCGVEAVQITCNRIRALVNDGTYSFNIIDRIDSDLSDYPRRSYVELIVGFTSKLLQSVEFNTGIEEIIKSLIDEGLATSCNDPIKKEAFAIFGRIALDTVAHDYKNLKHLFWEWENNPLEEYWLKPVIYQLIHAHCSNFDEREFDQILHWIESYQYSKTQEYDEDHSKIEAFWKREWLSALMETNNKRVTAAYKKYEQINPAKLEHPGIIRWTQTWSGTPSPITVKELSIKANTEIVRYLNGFKDTEPLGPTVPTEEGLRQTFEECVETNPQKITHDLQPFLNVKPQYQSSIFYGLRKAWNERKEFNWSNLLEFAYNILSSEQFWTQPNNGYFNYKDWTIAAVAELLLVGTQNDENAFNPKLLPIAEHILLILSNKVKSDRHAVDNTRITVLNSTPAKVYSALINYALRFARVHDVKQESVRWPVSIKSDFTKKLDQSAESSYEFSFTLGRYLPNLLYLDERWVIDNIDVIFTQHDEYLWAAAFTGYMFNSRIYEDLYLLVKQHGNYDKALLTDFTDTDVTDRLVTHICTGWIEDNETINDNDSLIFQLIYCDKPTLLSNLVHFFWRQRDKLPEKMKAKVRPTWRALYESLTQKTNIAEYQDVLSRLSGWVALVDKIDEEVTKWLEFSLKHIKVFSDSAFFVEDLLPHVSETPTEVGNIYLEMLFQNVYPSYNQEHIQEIIRILYKSEHKDVADRICNLYGEAGFDFLRSLYDENQN